MPVGFYWIMDEFLLFLLIFLAGPSFLFLWSSSRKMLLPNVVPRAAQEAKGFTILDLTKRPANFPS